jgi:hypothetical protein
MNHTTILCLITAIALSAYGIMVGISFVSNSAHAEYSSSSSHSSCTTTANNRLVCTSSPDNVCTYYGPNSVVCDNRNSQVIPDTSDTSDTPND